MERSGAKRPLVLVVDDDPTMQFLVGEALDAAGFSSREASDGRDALEIFGFARPDLILLDVVMPGMNGFEVCSAIRSLPAGADVPIIIMTGSDDIESIHRAFEAGATDFITKPINYSILGYRLRYMQRSKDKQVELRVSQQRLTDAQRLARLGHWEWSLVAGVVSMSEQSSKILGIDQERQIHTIADLLSSVHPDDRERVFDAFDYFIRTQEALHLEHKVIRPDGSEAIVYQEAEAGVDEATGRLRLTGTFQDISERKRVEQRIAHLEFHDSLTNLPNRTYFHKALSRSLEADSADRLAVYEIGIDQLQRLNDTMGHSYVEELAIAVANRLSTAFRVRTAQESIGRSHNIVLSRDPSGTFLLLTGAIEDTNVAIDPARVAIESLEGPFKAAGQEVFVTASIGIAVHPVDGLDAETLLRNAHAARSSIRSTGSSSFCFYAKNMNEDALERVRLEIALRKAVDEGAFELHYQPKVYCDSELPAGMEALIRWQSPEHGWVSPSKFIPLAEEFGLVVPIGEWVIKNVCQQLKAWDREGMAPQSCSVNIAAQQLDDVGFADYVARVFRECDIEPSRLELELTEGALMNDAERAIEVLDRLRSLGCRISLDDFGTGYSSLSYLNRFPLDIVKLDRSFILDIPASEDQSTLVEALIELAKKLRLEVVAEGVEDSSQRSFLLQAGCDKIQGFYYAKPLSPPDFVLWIRQQCGLSQKAS